ncbi:phospholipase A [Thiohalophilus thiocyanatoxydans]|uniref:Phospholipase A1 n=1 Tax=Thiohalophilus thiocyanatoxydans TaxID=381308 RepID=A0A4R8IR69_9GAMM|nr:phospholipase A [Thiohalophilus thiocyanatoxydans]TDX99622.1 phospholipase A1 [Thiohalophilus thiocyanatoxydans]
MLLSKSLRRPAVAYGLLFLAGLLPGNLPAAEADKTAETPLDKRVRIERETRFQEFVLTPHRPNYLLPLTYNSRPNQPPLDPQKEAELDETEVKFQISIKMPITDELFGDESTLYAAYTNQSYWQAYNDDNSQPFRETNHEPELFLLMQNDWQWLGVTNKMNTIGISHQSNGRSGDRSRSWNRVYAEFILERKNFYLSFKPWLRLESSGQQDDNPDIEHYMGKGEIRLAYANEKHTLSMMLRNNLKNDNRGAVELNWSFPMSRRARWFIQYFDGYGESLIDYNARVKRVGIGIALTDWL